MRRVGKQARNPVKPLRVTIATVPLMKQGPPVERPPRLTSPRDVIGNAPVGALDEDLRRACLAALECSRADCRDFALRMTWSASARSFLAHVAEAVKAGRV